MKMNENNGNLLIIGVLIAITALTGIVVLIRKVNKKTKSRDISTSEEPPFNENKAKEQFLTNIQYFIGNFESLYRVVNSKEWNRKRAINLIQQIDGIVKSRCDSQDLSNWWNIYFSDPLSMNDSQLESNLNLLLNIIYEMGINRDVASKIIVSNDTSLHYIDVEDRTLVEGTEMRVISPCWTYKDNVLERGLLTK